MVRSSGGLGNPTPERGLQKTRSPECIWQDWLSESRFPSRVTIKQIKHLFVISYTFKGPPIDTIRFEFDQFVLYSSKIKNDKINSHLFCDHYI